MADDLSDRLVYIGEREGAIASMRLTEEFWNIRPQTPITFEVSNTAVYEFRTPEDRAVFEQILQDNGIAYSNEIPEIEEPEGPATVTFSQGEFDNATSMVGFIVGYDSVDEVIAADTKELDVISGSFEEIGARMDYLIGQIDDVLTPRRQKLKEDVYKEFGYEPKDYWNIPHEVRDVIGQHLHSIYDKSELIPGEKNIELINLLGTHGFQHCPYTECGIGLSSRDYVIRNTETGRELWINQTTSHLARDHHLLEKGNNYGISAGEFYKHFMVR